jgi:hypothetical protein
MDDGFIIIVPAEGDPYHVEHFPDFEKHQVEDLYEPSSGVFDVGGIMRRGIILRTRETSTSDEVKIRELLATKYLGPPNSDG